MQLGTIPYREAWELQRSLAGAVSQGAMPDTVLLLEHPPVVTLGRRTDEGAELHVPEDADVEVVETNRGGKSTFHGPGQLVCYPILDLKRHGRDVKEYVRNLEEALIKTLAPFELDGERDRRAHRRVADAAAAQDRVDRRARVALGDDARVRAQRRSRSGAVHGVDHGVRARGRDVHDDRARGGSPGDGRRGAPACGRRARGGLRARARGASGRGRHGPLGRSRCTRSSRTDERGARPDLRRDREELDKAAAHARRTPSTSATARSRAQPPTRGRRRATCTKRQRRLEGSRATTASRSRP